MATDKFLNLTGLAEVAEYVNQKLKTVTVMPVAPSLNDIVLYNGATTADYQQGSIYLYTTVETYYKWSDLTNDYYTKAAAPEIGDTVYSDASGTDSGYTVEAYDAENNQITVNSLIYDRDTTGDTPINEWVSRGNTSITLNGKDKTGGIASFYAAPESGNEGQVLISHGENEDPTWGSYSGYSPSVIDEALCFNYGVIPDVEDDAVIFEMD